jgi:hypothetical protein
MIDTLRLEDFQNNVEEYLYRIRTGKHYFLKEKGTSRTWYIKPYIELELEPEVIKLIKQDAKKKGLTFDQMVVYVLLKYMDQKDKIKRNKAKCSKKCSKKCSGRCSGKCK